MLQREYKLYIYLLESLLFYFILFIIIIIILLVDQKPFVFIFLCHLTEDSLQ
jgi:hypothetical protein